MPEAVAFSVNTCVMVCGCTNYYNVFRKMMTSLPIRKQLPVSASATEVVTNFKILQFTCAGPFRRPLADFEGILPEKKYPTARLRACGPVRYNASLLAGKIMSET